MIHIQVLYDTTGSRRARRARPEQSTGRSERNRRVKVKCGKMTGATTDEARMVFVNVDRAKKKIRAIRMEYSSAITLLKLFEVADGQ